MIESTNFVMEIFYFTDADRTVIFELRFMRNNRWHNSIGTHTLVSCFTIEVCDGKIWSIWVLSHYVRSVSIWIWWSVKNVQLNVIRHDSVTFQSTEQDESYLSLKWCLHYFFDESTGKTFHILWLCSHNLFHRFFFQSKVPDRS